MTWWVLHVDLDQFVAAVEVLRRPELAGLPVVVGGDGDPTKRGVVSTASYEAREHGVGSGMPLRVAARKCPDAVFLPVDAPAYEAASAVVMETLRAHDAVVEVLGWDEAFLGVEADEPEAFARRLQDAVLAASGLRCSVGIGDNTLRAKTATGFAKPAGVHRITRSTWFEHVGDEPPDALWGVGRATRRKLAELGVTTVRQLAEADEAVLAARLGPRMGPWYRSVGRGVGRREVHGEAYVPRSHSRETTFQSDLTDWDAVRAELTALAARVARDVVDDGRPAVRVAVKVRYAPFLTQTRSAPLPEPTQDAGALRDAALAVLERFEAGRPVRLLGVRAEFADGGSRLGPGRR
ncbi:DNA polymerase IV [Thalassiella azotivora]